MSDDTKCPRCGNKMKNGKCPFCPKKGHVLTMQRQPAVVKELEVTPEDFGITDEALNKMIEDFYAAKNCKNCGHSAGDHWHQLGGCKNGNCTCKKFED